MKRFNKLFLLCLLFGTMFLTACGIEVTTNMTLEDGFSGSRIISCYVSNQDIASYFKGDSSKIDDIIRSNCPGVLTYTKKEETYGTSFIFELPFESLEDYKNDVSVLLNFSPEIEFSYTDSIFSSGVTLKENFTSADLLCFFEILLTEEYNMKENQLDSMWKIKDTMVSWNGESYKSETDKIQISKLEQLSFDGIHIYTKELDDRSFERTLQFRIPTKTLDKKVLKLNESFKKLTPEYATGKWVNTKTGKNYEITFSNDTFAGLTASTNQIFGVDLENGSAVSTFDEYQVFQFHIERNESFDFSKFLCNEDGTVPVSYHYKPNSMTETDIVKMQQEINNSFTDETDENGYYLIYEGNCDTLSIGYLGTTTVPIESCVIDTTLKSKGELERVMTFELENVYTEEEWTYLISYFAQNNTSNLEMKLEETDNKTIFTLIQKGKNEDLNYSNRLLFGADDNTVNQETKNTIWSASQDVFLEEVIDLSRFIGTLNKDMIIDYIFTDDSNGTMNKFSINSDLYEIEIKEKEKDNVQQASIHGCRFTTSYEGTAHYVPGLLILLGAVLLLLLFLWLLIKKNPMKSTK